MIVIRQHRIFKEDIKANPNVLYIFGDNLERTGFGGQAKEMRGHQNSFGIATKRLASHVYPHSYFFDGKADVIESINEDSSLLRATIILAEPQAIIIPLDGIGTGLSKMPEYAPRALAYINDLLKELETL